MAIVGGDGGKRRAKAPKDPNKGKFNADPNFSDYQGNIDLNQYVKQNSPEDASTGGFDNTYNYDKSGLDRGEVYQSDYEHLDDERAQNQGLISSLANSTAKFIGKTGLNVVGGLAGTAYGVGDAIAKGDVSKIWDNGFNDSVDAMNTKLDDIFKVYKSSDYQESNFLAKAFLHPLQFIDETSDALSFTAGAILTELATQGLATEAILPNALKYMKFLSRGAEAAEATAELTSGLGRAKNIIGDFGQVTRQLATGAAYESTIEARQATMDLRKKLYADWASTHGDEPMDDMTKNDIDTRLQQAGLFTYLTNLALVGSTNMLEFPKIFGLGYKSSKIAEGAIARNAESGLFEAAASNRSIAGNVLRALKNPFYEGGVEEGLQNVIQGTAKDYWSRKNDNGSRIDVSGFLHDFSHNLADTYTSKEGWNSIGMGMVIGALGAPGRGALSVFGKDSSIGKHGYDTNEDGSVTRAPLWTGGLLEPGEEHRAEQREIAGVVDQLNKHTNLFNSMRANYDHLVTSHSLEKDKAAALQANDIFEFNNAKDDQTHSYIMSRIKANMYDDLNDTVDNMKKMSPEDFYSQFKGDSNIPVADKAKFQMDSINQFKQKIENTNDAVKVADDVYKGNNDDLREELVHSIAASKNLDVREKQMNSDIHQLSKGTVSNLYSTDTTLISDKVKQLQENGDDEDRETIKDLKSANQDLTVEEHNQMVDFAKNHPTDYTLNKDKITDLLKDSRRLREKRQSYLDLYNTLFTKQGQNSFEQKQQLLVQQEQARQDAEQAKELAKQLEEDKKKNIKATVDKAAKVATENVGGIQPPLPKATNTLPTIPTDIGEPIGETHTTYGASKSDIQVGDIIDNKKILSFDRIADRYKRAGQVGIVEVQDFSTGKTYTMDARNLRGTIHRKSNIVDAPAIDLDDQPNVNIEDDDNNVPSTPAVDSKYNDLAIGDKVNQSGKIGTIVGKDNGKVTIDFDNGGRLEASPDFVSLQKVEPALSAEENTVVAVEEHKQDVAETEQAMQDTGLVKNATEELEDTTDNTLKYQNLDTKRSLGNTIAYLGIDKIKLGRVKNGVVEAKNFDEYNEDGTLKVNDNVDTKLFSANHYRPGDKVNLKVPSYEDMQSRGVQDYTQSDYNRDISDINHFPIGIYNTDNKLIGYLPTQSNIKTNVADEFKETALANNLAIREQIFNNPGDVYNSSINSKSPGWLMLNKKSVQQSLFDSLGDGNKLADRVKLGVGKLGSIYVNNGSNGIFTDGEIITNNAQDGLVYAIVPSSAKDKFIAYPMKINKIGEDNAKMVVEAIRLFAKSQEDLLDANERASLDNVGDYDLTKFKDLNQFINRIMYGTSSKDAPDTATFKLFKDNLILSKFDNKKFKLSDIVSKQSTRDEIASILADRYHAVKLEQLNTNQKYYSYQLNGDTIVEKANNSYQQYLHDNKVITSNINSVAIQGNERAFTAQPVIGLSNEVAREPRAITQQSSVPEQAVQDTPQVAEEVYSRPQQSASATAQSLKDGKFHVGTQFAYLESAKTALNITSMSKEDSTNYLTVTSIEDTVLPDSKSVNYIDSNGKTGGLLVDNDLKITAGLFIKGQSPSDKYNELKKNVRNDVSTPAPDTGLSDIALRMEAANQELQARANEQVKTNKKLFDPKKVKPKNLDLDVSPDHFIQSSIKSAEDLMRRCL